MKPTPISSFSIKAQGPSGASFSAMKSVYPSGLSGPSRVSAAQGPSFGNVMTNLVGNINGTLSKPDEMLRETVLHGTYDIHDVMLANSKADLAINLTSQFTTKVIQAYDRILQIQV